MVVQGRVLVSLLGMGCLFLFDHIHLYVIQYLNTKQQILILKKCYNRGSDSHYYFAILCSDEKADFIIHSSNQSVLCHYLECYLCYRLGQLLEGGAYWNRGTFFKKTALERECLLERGCILEGRC